MAAKFKMAEANGPKRPVYCRFFVLDQDSHMHTYRIKLVINYSYTLILNFSSMPIKTLIRQKHIKTILHVFGLRLPGPFAPL